MRAASVIRRLNAAARRGVEALWSLVIPALLAGVVLKFLVPPVGTPGARGIVATLGQRYPVVLVAGCFLLFSAIAQHWRPAVLPAGPSESPGRQGRVAETLATVVALALAVGLMLLVRAKLADRYQVLSGSMLPSFEPGDQLAGNKLAYSRGRLPHRGDIALFGSSVVAQLGPPAHGGPLPEVLLKRVVGLPGDRITMRGGSPVINGWEVPNCAASEYIYVLPDGEGGIFRGLAFVEFLEDHVYLTVHATPIPSFNATYVVQPGEVFVLGDNRTNSLDSRSYRGGAGAGIPTSAIEARADWFLLGTHRSGDVDLSRLLQPIAKLEGNVPGKGINAGDLQAGISRCLANRPAVTRPPSPVEPSARDSASSGGPPT
jgi:signal peptidase I